MYPKKFAIKMIYTSNNDIDEQISKWLEEYKLSIKKVIDIKYSSVFNSIDGKVIDRAMLIYTEMPDIELE